jgi:hypothetical protein
MSNGKQRLVTLIGRDIERHLKHLRKRWELSGPRHYGYSAGFRYILGRLEYGDFEYRLLPPSLVPSPVHPYLHTPAVVR